MNFPRSRACTALFWSIAAGIVLAAGMIPLAVFGSAAIGIMLLVYLFTDSQKGRNRYGASPKYPWL